MSQPPSLAQRLLARLLSPDDREDILANLDELHRHHAEKRGNWFAARWYWRDALILALRFRQRPASPRNALLAGLGTSVRAAATSFVRAPLHALMATATLGIGIAATTLVAGLVWDTVLRPLPFPEAGQLDWIWPRGAAVVTRQQFDLLRHGVASTTELTAFSARAFALSAGTEPSEIAGMAVTTNHFEVLGLRPFLGRALGELDSVEGAEPVVLLSYNLWKDRFGADPNILGRRIELYNAAAIPMIQGAFSGRSHTVIGVLAPRYQPFGTAAEVVVPLVMSPADPDFSNLSELSMVGRRRAGARPPDVERALLAQLDQAPELAGLRASVAADTVRPLRETLAAGVQATMFAAFGVVVLILVIACGNVVNLLLVRLRTRKRELSIRRALGASRRQIIAQLLAESAVLAAISAGLGALLAYLLRPAMLAALPADLATAELPILGPPLGVTLVAMVGVTLGCGLIQAGSLAPESSVSFSAGRAGLGDTRFGRRVANGLVVAEIGMALMVTYAAFAVGLSLTRLTQVPLGFAAENVVTMRVAPAARQYRDPAVRRALVDQLLARARALPGVTHAGAIHFLPIAEGGPSIRFRQNPGDEAEPIDASYRVITPGYLEALRIPMVSGRAFGPEDATGGTPVGLVNRTLARRLWPNELAPDRSAIGRSLYRSNGDLFFEVVGVVEDVRQAALALPPEAEIYLPLTQTNWASAMSIVVHGTRARGELEQALRSIVRSLDPNLAITRMAAMEDVVRNSVARDRFLQRAFQLFAILALGLGALGTFTLAAAAVTRRQRELGVRLALGATRGNIAFHELARAAGLAGMGLALGLGGALAGARALDGLLYGVAAVDPTLLMAVSVVMVAVVALGVALPTWRASRIDPSRALEQP